MSRHPLRSLSLGLLVLVAVLAFVGPAVAHTTSTTWGGACPVTGTTEHATNAKFHRARTAAVATEWMLAECTRVRAIAYYETYETGSRQVRSCTAEHPSEALTVSCGSKYATKNWSTHQYYGKVNGVWKWVTAGSTHR